MAHTQENPLKSIKTSKIILPILIGLGVVVYMFYNEFKDNDSLQSVGEYFKLNFTTLFWFFVAILLMLSRDIGYMIRIRILTDHDFSWRQAFRVVMLWEFTSAITPSAIGGTSVAILYINKEGINIGRSSAVVMATSFLDELYFILMFPLLFIIVNPVYLFIIGETHVTPEMSYINQFFWFAVIGYTIKLAYILVLSYGLFVNPRGLKWLLLKIFKLPLLRKWKFGAHKAGTEIIISAKELKKKPFKFWLKAFAATFFSWTSRYWVVNALFIAFGLYHLGFTDNFLVFARQLVMWIMMLIMPTPGGSGAAELIFTEFLGDFIPVAGLAVVLSLVWRIATYYPYLIVGVILFPKWIKNKFVNKKTNDTQQL